MKVIYNGSVLNLPAGTTIEEARAALVGIYPEIANATAEIKVDGIEFVVKAECTAICKRKSCLA